jgi:hypothetical protein
MFELEIRQNKKYMQDRIPYNQQEYQTTSLIDNTL